MPGRLTRVTLTTVNKPAFIYLASQSPRRRQLLEQMGVRCELLLADDTEDPESLEVQRPNEKPAAYVKRVTLLKLQAAQQRVQLRKLPRAPILCADTTVALGSEIYGKPVDDRDARRMLAELAGHSHRVLTAVAVAKADKVLLRLSASRVTFSAISKSEIAAYVQSGEPSGKAGAYAVQGRAAGIISHISGSYSGIMGLPLFETTYLLRWAGIKL